MRKNNGVLSNFSWKFAERITAQLITLVVSIVLARLLEPKDYGIIAIVNIFITFLNVFVSDGLGSALIQKKNADKLDFSSVFWFNIIFSIILYALLFVLAPYFVLFYDKQYDILVPVLRILGIRLIFSAINSVQHAYVAKKMIFYKFFWSTLFGTIFSAIVGIWMAYHGYGVWALVYQYLTNVTIDTVFLGVSLRKMPIMKISLSRLKILLRFGIPILGVGLLITSYQEIRAMIIGKLYSSADLAYYEKGKQVPSLVVNNINTSIGAVLFSKLSFEQKNKDKLKNITRTSIKFGLFLLCPVMLGLAAIAKPFVVLVLTEKWVPCVPLLQLFCIIYLFMPIHTANMQAIKAMGKSSTVFYLEVIKKIIELVLLIFTMKISVNAIVVGLVLMTIGFTFFNGYPNIKLLNYTFKEQINDISVPLLMSLIMFVIVVALGRLDINIKLLLPLQILTGVFIYILICIVTKNREFKFIVQCLKNNYKNKFI